MVVGFHHLNVDTIGCGVRRRLVSSRPFRFAHHCILKRHPKQGKCECRARCQILFITFAMKEETNLHSKTQKKCQKCKGAPHTYDLISPLVGAREETP